MMNAPPTFAARTAAFLGSRFNMHFGCTMRRDGLCEVVWDMGLPNAPGVGQVSRALASWDRSPDRPVCVLRPTGHMNDTEAHRISDDPRRRV